MGELLKLPKTKEEAKQLNAKMYFTGVPCIHGHLSPRYIGGRCLDCAGINFRISIFPPPSDETLQDYKHLLHLPITHEEAVAIGSKHYFTRKPCRKGHLNRRSTTTRICWSCAVIHNKERRKQFPEERKKFDQKYKKEKRKDPFHRLNNALSSSMRRFIRKQRDGSDEEIDVMEGQTFFEFVGYSEEEFKRNLESKFESGMTWENFGNGSNIKENGIDTENRWHVDHIIPISLFNLDNIKDAWKLDNLQPLWAKDNMSKCNRYIGHPNNPQWIETKNNDKIN